MDNYTTWTNERHNKYLDSMEAYFVQQLNQSRSMHREHNRGDKDVPLRSPVTLNKASKQFSHSRDGGWPKKIPEKDQPHYLQQDVSEGSGQNFVDENCDKKVEDSCGRYLNRRSRNARN